MNEKTRYDQVLQELKREYGKLIAKYVPKLHKASHDDHPGEKLSHMDMVRKIQEDYSRISRLHMVLPFVEKVKKRLYQRY